MSNEQVAPERVWLRKYDLDLNREKGGCYSKTDNGGPEYIRLDLHTAALAKQGSPPESDVEPHSPSVAEGIDLLAVHVLAMCKARGWSLHWTHRGAYLHLESSELIEAIRGKRGSVLDEAGDVLFVLMSITEHAGIPFSEVVAQAASKLDGLLRPHHEGEEQGSPPAAKWDKSGLKESCQRALRIGRTHQEMDIQLVLDMLLEIEALEAARTSEKGTHEPTS